MTARSGWQDGPTYCMSCDHDHAAGKHTRPFVVGDRVRAIYFSDMASVGTVLAVAGDDVTVRYEWDEVVHHGPALRHVSDGAL